MHRLVLLAFVGPCPDGMEACHANDIPTDNRLANLRWGTHADNMRDRIENGGNPFVNQTHCKRGHEFSDENTRLGSNGERNCRACARARWAVMSDQARQRRNELRRARRAAQREAA